MLFLNSKNISHVSKVIKKLNFSIDEFTDETFYPKVGTEDELVARFFFFMVAIDHRTSRPGRSFEGLVKGKFYHGADLLYRLAALKFHEDPSFFSPENMVKISGDDVKTWLSAKEPREVTIPDPELRAYLLNDAARKLLDHYNGRVTELIKASGLMLYRGDGKGFIQSLRTFRAYEDPVEKKSFLLAKFLVRRGLVAFKDVENIQVPVDNHLTRIALRLGLVELSGEYKSIFDKEASYEEDIALRIIIRKAYKEIANLSMKRPDVLDDFLWIHGRKCCYYGEPECDKCLNPILREKGCPLRSVCAYYNGEIELLNEHNYLKTWYY